VGASRNIEDIVQEVLHGPQADPEPEEPGADAGEDQEPAEEEVHDPPAPEPVTLTCAREIAAKFTQFVEDNQQVFPIELTEALHKACCILGKEIVTTAVMDARRQSDIRSFFSAPNA
jgi:hypothetical protein